MIYAFTRRLFYDCFMIVFMIYEEIVLVWYNKVVNFVSCLHGYHISIIGTALSRFHSRRREEEEEEEVEAVKEVEED